MGKSDLPESLRETLGDQVLTNSKLVLDVVAMTGLPTSMISYALDHVFTSRLDRIAFFIAELSKRCDTLEEVLKSETYSDNSNILNAAAHAVILTPSREKVKIIAEAAAQGIDSEDGGHTLTVRLISILRELDDDQIGLLNIFRETDFIVLNYDALSQRPERSFLELESSQGYPEDNSAKVSQSLDQLGHPLALALSLEAKSLLDKYEDLSKGNLVFYLNPLGAEVLDVTQMITLEA